jgi:hypothetical protein
MAVIHFVKDGKKPDGTRLTKSFDVEFESADKALGSFESRRTSVPPTINPEVAASDYAAYRHVVLETEADEKSLKFPSPGFYYIIGISPDECQRTLNLG